jgi:hypothetical protein
MSYPSEAEDAQNLEAFYMRYPSFICEPAPAPCLPQKSLRRAPPFPIFNSPVPAHAFVRTGGPALLAGGVYGLCQAIPNHLASLDATPYGLKASAMYALYGTVLSFAVHGWYCTFVDREQQLQAYEPRSAKFAGKFEDRLSYKDKPVQPRRAAVRQTATFWTSLVYSVFPFAAPTTSWSMFFAWTFALAVYWDLHFYCVHKFAHENGKAYKFLHKLHHIYKASDVFVSTRREDARTQPAGGSEPHAHAAPPPFPLRTPAPPAPPLSLRTPD